MEIFSSLAVILGVFALTGMEARAGDCLTDGRVLPLKVVVQERVFTDFDQGEPVRRPIWYCNLNVLVARRLSIGILTRR